jgi:PD-(D/E)XK nuclease superfamily protein
VASRSFSAIEQFEFCEMQYFYDRILKLPRPPNHYFSIGGLYHDCLARMTEEPEFDLDALVTETLNIHRQKTDWNCPTSDDLLIAEVVANLWRVNQEICPHLQPLEVETWARRFYLGKIDLLSATTPVVNSYGAITGSIPEKCVIDWKVKFSAKKKRDQDSTDNSKQLALYCLEKGVTRAAFVEIPRDLAQPLNTIVTEFTAEQLEWWGRWFNHQFAAAESRGQDPKNYRLAPPGHPLCSARWCHHYTRCPGGTGDTQL